MKKAVEKTKKASASVSRFFPISVIILNFLATIPSKKSVDPRMENDMKRGHGHLANRKR